MAAKLIQVAQLRLGLLDLLQLFFDIELVILDREVVEEVG